MKHLFYLLPVLLLLEANVPPVIAHAVYFTERSSHTSCPVKAYATTYTYNPLLSNGPSHWGDLDPSYQTCSTGTSQSPIDLPGIVTHANPAQRPDLMFRTAYMKFDKANANWHLECSRGGSSCGRVKVHGRKGYLKQIHFHSPSEHTLNGKRYPLEAHFVHESSDGSGHLAVLGILFQYPDEESYAAGVYATAPADFGRNAVFDDILKNVEGDVEEFAVDLSRLVGEDLGYVSYLGSLTTPPCTEGVLWMHSLAVATVSRRQTQAYLLTVGSPYDGNNRPLQPLNGRDVVAYVP